MDLFKGVLENGTAPQDKDSQPLRQTVMTAKIEGWNTFFQPLTIWLLTV
ncbi:hypothetical protein STRCR_0158 [Streptococcus criceti HS-6]|uniref:Uncharacterized protein n=1 Tax=Streptococcus criceti HS-6 TaxID=873449 RepID=G5JNC1_STRCG|nr:hypothetical protein STRCR_0158 [Streptococcus criceti HS-6]